MEDVEREANAAVEALIPQFQFEKLLNQDQAGRRIILLGTINSQPAILIAERAAFSTVPAHLSTFASSLSHIANLGTNDIYHWFLASYTPSSSSSSSSSPVPPPSTTSTPSPVQPPDLKLTLIHPCTPSHIAKYSHQGYRLVTETPALYRSHIAPYISSARSSGRLTWLYNILSGLTEQSSILYRSPSPSSTSPHSSRSSDDPNTSDPSFILLPDLNWDRLTLPSLHLLAIPTRRDLASLRSLTISHLPWLRALRVALLTATTALYPVEMDQLKLYVHYQPTYYHLHVHVVHVRMEAGATQAVGKAVGLEGVIGVLEGMAREGEDEEGGERVREGEEKKHRMQEGSEERGMADVSLTYVVGEASELWTEIWAPLKEKERQKKEGESNGEA